MTEAPSHLIRMSGGRTRVLRLHADGTRCWPLAYTVAHGQAMCRVCGCINFWGCAGGCAWADASRTLCSRCSDRIAR